MELFWSLNEDDLLQKLATSRQGLANHEARSRIKTAGRNSIRPKKNVGWLFQFLHQFTTPLIALLLVCALLSFFLHDTNDALIIFIIVLASGLLGFIQEKSAFNAMQKLLSLVQLKAVVLRDNIPSTIAVDHLVPGDIVLLKAGDIVAADCRLLSVKDLFIDESTLTGESLPVEKKVGQADANASLGNRFSALYMGSHIVSGEGTAVVVHTGQKTELGTIAETIEKKPPANSFEIGIRRFGFLLMNVTLGLVSVIFLVNLYFHRPLFESFLFSLALAVGLTPQLLPAIVTINMARGTKHMAKKRVIVKKLSAIQNFGSMDTLCIDKTGTLTKGVVELYAAVDALGKPSEEVAFLAYLNAHFQLGYQNPIDKAIMANKNYDITAIEKFDEIPYDFQRKRLSVLVKKQGKNILITKGAFHNILDICDISDKKSLEQEFEKWSKQGFRTLGLASKTISETTVGKEDEGHMTFEGFLHFFDPPKKDAKEVIARIKSLGIEPKMITGDNSFVTKFIAGIVGLDNSRVMTGSVLNTLSDKELLAAVNETTLFAEIEPQQKLRIIDTLKRSGKTVGFMGDGINDIMAMHTADVSISVKGAIDIAQEVAHIVLLKKDLSILSDGVIEGRKIFANTLKYIFMATSANFGNMFSMAGASLIMNFLPMLPKQILLTNFMTDIPEMTISSDNVDKEMTEKPCRWDMRFIYRFMFVFGLISSLFDYLTFLCLYYVLGADETQFRTGWVIESIVSASLIVLFIRTRRSIVKSCPSWPLLLATIATIVITIAIPYSPLASLFQLTPLPPLFYGFIAVVLILYVIVIEISKKIFYGRI